VSICALLDGLENLLVATAPIETPESLISKQKEGFLFWMIGLTFNAVGILLGAQRNLAAFWSVVVSKIKSCKHRDKSIDTFQRKINYSDTTSESTRSHEYCR
jgi:hypothetical protein